VSRSDAGSWASLRHRDFAIFFTAASISNAGSWMQSVAVPVLLFDMTGKAAWLGLASAATLGPAVLITPYAGALSDRVSRRAILIATQTVQMIASAVLLWFYGVGSLTPWWIISISLVNGVATGFQSSTWQSFVPMLVPKELLLDAVRLNSMQYTLARAIGPASAALVMAAWGPGWAIFANAITYLLVLIALVVVNPTPNSTVAKSAPVREVITEGARYVWAHPGLRLTVGLAFVTSFCGQSLYGLAAAMSKRIYHHPSSGNAGLLTALGIGALISSGVAVTLGKRLPRSRQAFTGLSLYSVGLVLIPLTRNYSVGLLGFGFIGMAHLQMAVALNTTAQASVPDQYRGRVMSFYMMGILGGLPLGAVIYGRLGDSIGLRDVLAIDAAIVTTVIAVFTARGWFAWLDDPLAERGGGARRRTPSPAVSPVS
jgi:MFS family permease